MSTPSTTHIRNLLNLFNSILEGGDPIGIFQEQIEQFERNFTPTKPLTLYINIPKGYPQTSFTKNTFTLASLKTLTPPGLRLDVYCPCIDLGSSGVVLPRGIEFSAYTSFDPPTRSVSFPSIVSLPPTVYIPFREDDCKRMNENKCNYNPKTKKSPPIPYTIRGLLEEFKHSVMEYLPDLLGITPDGIDHGLPHTTSDMTPYTHVEVVKRFTIAEDTTFDDDLLSIVGGGVNLVGNMSKKFWLCASFNSYVDEWDTSQVTCMSCMFLGASTFNQPLTGWNTQNVQNMYQMFRGATAFNRPLEGWNTSGVQDMNQIFHDATAFNQPLERWDVSRVTRMNNMFLGATSFNQPLAGWNTSRVTNMFSMFKKSKAFNQPLEQWDVSGVVNMISMFRGAIAFNQPLAVWNTGRVIDMNGLFADATAFNQPLAGWNTSGVRDMSYMFQEAAAFNQPLERWDVSGVVYMISMFQEAISFNQSLEDWYTGRVIDMGEMFDESGMETIPKWYVDFYHGYW